jgi:hypothetical protein
LATWPTGRCWRTWITRRWRRRCNSGSTGCRGGTWTAELQSPFEPGLILRSFAAPTRAELESQIEDYLKKDGTSDLARWLKALDARTATGVMDGNPNSTTALTAGYVYSEYGMSPVTTRAEIEEGYDPEGTVGFALLGDVGFIRVEGYDAQSYSVNPFLPVRLSSRVRLDVGLPLNYTEVEGSQVFRGGLQFGLPILIVKRNLRENQRWLWQLAPSAGLQLAGSLDQLSGGMLVSFGGTSLLSYHFGPLEISLGNQITAHESLDVTFGDYSFDPDISSQILKNGLKVGVPIGKHWFAEAYAIDTELLGGDTAMTRYTTVGGGFGFRKNTKKRAYLMVGGYAQFGDDWSAASVQFGTGWKF